MANQIDYAFKSYVLKEHADLLQRQKRSSLYDYSLNKLINEGVVLYAFKSKKKYYNSSIELMDYVISNDLVNEYKECIKINHAEYERTHRLKERVRAMLLNGSCIFLTLTFTDQILNSTTPKQRRVAVSRFLKKYNCSYVANIDFGVDKTKTMREHYHALINCDKVNYKHWQKFGNLDFERVRNKGIENNTSKLSKYIAKLANHSIKESAKRSSLIYSR